MALSTPSASPAVVVKEIDLTGGVPNVQSTTGAMVGNFRWGPAEQRVLIDNETTLATTFATPDSDTTSSKTKQTSMAKRELWLAQVIRSSLNGPVN